MRYGLGNVLVCLSSVWGCDAYVKHLMLKKSLQTQTNVSLWGIRGKPKDIILIIKQRAKCLLLTMVSFWRRVSL
jgi:hypothetical protein